VGNTDFGIVHVDLDRLDRLLNLVGELVINRSSFIDQARQARSRYGFKEQVLNLVETTERTSRICEEIQGKIIQARLVPVSTVFDRFAGLVRKLSGSDGKELALNVVGGKTEVDKRTIDELAEPLVHLVRNAIDHGIEKADERERADKPRCGTITLEAQHEGNRLIVEVRDDGGGADIEAIHRKAIARSIVGEDEELSEKETLALLFRAGFSTRDQLSETSGRGVGLDAAKKRVEMLGGSLQLTSIAGQGCTTRIDLQLTTAIIEALMVGVQGETYALPLDHVQEILRIGVGEVSTVEGCEVVDVRGEALPLLHLAELVELHEDRSRDGHLAVVVVRYGDSVFGLAVDDILRRHDIVIKGMGRRLSATRGLAGASIGGDGAVVMVLDVATLFREAIMASAEQSE